MKSVIFGLLVIAGLAGTASSAQAYYPPYRGGVYRNYYQPYYGNAYRVSPYRGYNYGYPVYAPAYRYGYGYYNRPVYVAPAPYYYGPANTIGIYGPRVGVRIGF